MKEVIWDEGIKRLEGPPHLAWVARDGILGKGHSMSKGMFPRNGGKCGLQRQKTTEEQKTCLTWRLGQITEADKVDLGASEGLQAGVSDGQSVLFQDDEAVGRWRVDWMEAVSFQRETA